jgi:hypothetical protein
MRKVYEQKIFFVKETNGPKNVNRFWQSPPSGPEMHFLKSASVQKVHFRLPCLTTLPAISISDHLKVPIVRGLYSSGSRSSFFKTNVLFTSTPRQNRRGFLISEKSYCYFRVHYISPPCKADLQRTGSTPILPTECRTPEPRKQKTGPGKILQHKNPLYAVPAAKVGPEGLTAGKG